MVNNTIVAPTTITPLPPFGIKIEPEHIGTPLGSLDIAELRDLVLYHHIIVLRGFLPLRREAFEEYAAGFGEILKWNFGAILDVIVHADAQNYLFTHGSVPHHWDGAFAEIVPFLQIFQCLAAPEGTTTGIAGGAPDNDAGGETVFCDTTRVWGAAPPEQRIEWATTSVTYHTEKLAHYGGDIRANLVSRHPITGETTLRFAEPPDDETAPLNPLTLEVHGNTQAHLMATLQPELYSEPNCYVHNWREGDFVIADNHALLHARKAFRPGASRHLQRIHVK